MIYRLCCSSGNTIGIDEYVSYSEIDSESKLWCRYLEIRADGAAVRYSTEHPADSMGVLPEGEWDEAEVKKAEYGITHCISE